jgi:hypothetical protein
MPFEDMRGQVGSLNHLGAGSLSDSSQPPVGFDSYHPNSSSSSLFHHALPNRSHLLGAPPGQSFQQNLPTSSPGYLRSPGSNYSYDGRVGRNGGAMGPYNSQLQQQQLQQSQSPPTADPIYGNPLSYGSGPYAPNQFNSSSPGRPFQGDYQQRQYNPRRPPTYDGSLEMMGGHPNQMNASYMAHSHPGVAYQRGGGWGGVGTYGSDHRYAPSAYGPPQHQPSYPYPQSELFGLSSHNEMMRPRDIGGAGGAPGLSPGGTGGVGGGYYPPSQPNPYAPSQREGGNNNNNTNGGSGSSNSRYN